MPPASLLRYCYLAWFSQPRGERILYRSLRRSPVLSLVEIGLGNAARARRLLSVVRRYRPDSRPRYTGIDLFEARPRERVGLSLKRAHQALGDCGAKIQLVPGDPLAALARAANSLPNTDLLLIAADVDQDALARAWFYVPRMLHAGSLVFEERAGPKGPGYHLVSLPEVAARAKAAEVRGARRAA